MKVLNHDIANLVRRMRRFKVELVKSVSSNTSEFSGHDLERFGTYIEAIKAFKSWSVSQPSLDLPETSPMEVELGDMPVSDNMENDDIALVVNLFNIVEQEVVNSQSARRSSGMIIQDSLRFDTYIEKIENFVADYIGPITPLDLPESSPMVAATGAGRTGI